jgi:hypothetical protein
VSENGSAAAGQSELEASIIGIREDRERKDREQGGK